MILAGDDRATIDGQAKNALLEHFLITANAGHGDDQKVPPDLDPADAIEYVEIRRTFRGPIDELD